MSVLRLSQCEPFPYVSQQRINDAHLLLLHHPLLNWDRERQVLNLPMRRDKRTHTGRHSGPVIWGWYLVQTRQKQGTDVRRGSSLCSAPFSDPNPPLLGWGRGSCRKNQDRPPGLRRPRGLLGSVPYQSSGHGTAPAAAWWSQRVYPKVCMLQAPCLLMAVVKTLKRLLFATPVSRGFLFVWMEGKRSWFFFPLSFSPIVLFRYAFYFHPQKAGLRYLQDFWDVCSLC